MVSDLQDAETLDTEYLIPDIILMLYFMSTFWLLDLGDFF